MLSNLNAFKRKFNNDKNYCIDRKLKKEVDMWLKYRFQKCSNISFDVIVDMFFDKDRKIYFKKDNDYCGKSFYYGYDNNIDKMEDKLIILNVGDDSVYKYDECKICFVGKEQNKKSYLLSYKDGEFNKKLISEERMDIINDKVYFYRFNASMYYISLNDSDKQLVFSCLGNKFEQKNDEKIKEYLLSLNNFDDVRGIYNNIYKLLMEEPENIERITLVVRNKGYEVSKLDFDFKTYFGKKYNYNDVDRDISYNYQEPCIWLDDYMCDGTINFRNGNFELNVSFSYYDGCNKENLLLEELINLDFSLGLEHICNVLRKEISDDVNFKVTISNNNNITDILEIKDNDVVLYKYVFDNKVILVNKDGVFSYIVGDDNNKISIDITKDSVTKCEYISSNGIESDDMGGYIYNSINEAKNCKIKTKRMLDNLINNNNNN